MTLIDFLLAIPAWEVYFGFTDRLDGIVPSLHVVNELFALGRVDAGMSGGIEWKPFELDETEYALLVEELLTDPRLHFATPAEGA